MHARLIPAGGGTGDGRNPEKQARLKGKIGVSCGTVVIRSVSETTSNTLRIASVSHMMRIDVTPETAGQIRFILWLKAGA